MKKRRNSKSRPFRDILRLVSAHDLLGRAGTLMMRKSIRAALWTIGITSSGLLAKRLGLPGFTAAQAVAAPVIVGGGMFTAGAALTYIPRTLSRRLTAIAEANDLNLMEDYRKSQLPDHLNALWDNVFFYESALRYSPTERRAESRRILEDREHILKLIDAWDRPLLERLGVRNPSDMEDLTAALIAEKPVSDLMEKSRAGFTISSVYALNHALPQATQTARIGYRLNLLEDFRDGAYFDGSDVKLVEQYIGNSTICDIKADTRMGRIASLMQIPATLKRDFWFFFITRKVAIATGRAVKHLNDRHHTDLFNSQVLLWPGEEDADWLAKFQGASKELLELRRSIMTGALGPDYETAVNVLDRMLLLSFEFATQLRCRFDPEYCDGSLDRETEDTRRAITNNVESDLRRFDYRRQDIRKAALHMHRTAQQQKKLIEYLRAGDFARILEDKPALRAVRIAFHIDRNSLKKALLSSGSPLDTSVIDSEINAAANDHETYSNKLILLRLHHQLAILQIEGYRNLAERLAYTESDRKTNAPAGQ